MTRTTDRWTPTRKREVVEAISSRQMTRSQAMSTYGLSDEELSGWEDRFSRFGRPGLSVRRLQVLGRTAESR